MLFLPLYIEALRSRPRLVFWLASLAQAALWVAVPLVFYSAPPGELPQVLALGHEFSYRGDFGPPLAYWLAEIAFRAGGLFGVYVLSQICVITTYWCVFALARAVMDATHAVLAVLLMAGISAYTVPTPDFGPALLAAPLWGLALLYYWRAVGQKERRSWYVAGVCAALILLTSTAALILIGLLVAFTAITARGRASLATIEPWVVASALLIFVLLHCFWLANMSDILGAGLARLRGAGAGANAAAMAWLIATLVFAHTGLVILVVLAGGWPQPRSAPAPAITRPPLEPFTLTFVKVFALFPALLASIAAVLVADRLPVGGAAPLLVLSALAVVVAAGERIELHHQQILGLAWAGLLVVPAFFVPLALVLLPWTTGTELKIAQPAAAMGRFFAESFERRTGQPLAIVSGDAGIAALVALAAPSRPSVYFEADPERTPRITPDEIMRRGAVVVWPAAETTEEAPPAIKAFFPDLVAEVPQTFTRPVRGRLPPLRIGWGMIRPAHASPAR